MQRRRNNELVSHIENNDISEISLREFSDMLLPEVEDFNNVSSESDDSDTDSYSDIEGGDPSKRNPSNKSGALASAVLAPSKSFKMIKKEAWTLKRQSSKLFKKASKIIHKKKSEKYKKYFTLCVIVIFFVFLACRVIYIQQARDLHHFLTSDEVTINPAGTIFSSYDVHFEDIIEKFQCLKNYEVVGRTLSVICIFFCECIC